MLLGNHWTGIRLLKRDAPLQLFDLVADLGETTDVAAKHPEVVARITEIMRTGRTDNEFWKAPKN